MASQQQLHFEFMLKLYYSFQFHSLSDNLSDKEKFFMEKTELKGDREQERQWEQADCQDTDPVYWSAYYLGQRFPPPEDCLQEEETDSYIRDLSHTGTFLFAYTRPYIHTFTKTLLIHLADRRDQTRHVDLTLFQLRKVIMYFVEVSRRVPEWKKSPKSAAPLFQRSLLPISGKPASDYDTTFSLYK